MSPLSARLLKKVSTVSLPPIPGNPQQAGALQRQLKAWHLRGSTPYALGPTFPPEEETTIWDCTSPQS
eukprot:6476885-Amphidinium_carterae.1